MVSLKIINIGNGSKNYPGNFTKKERETIEKNLIYNTLHLFSGKSTIGHIRIDFKCPEATLNTDVFEYLNRPLYQMGNFQTVIIDAPYNRKFADVYNKVNEMDENQFIIFAQSKKTTELFNLIKERVNPSRIIIKSWNYFTLKGYKIDEEESFIGYAGGYRKPTYLLIFDKIRGE